MTEPAQQIIVGHDLGTDEAAGHVRVDRAGGLDGRRPARDAAGRHLFVAAREEGDAVGGLTDASQHVGGVKSLQAHFLQERGAVAGVETSDLGLDRRREGLDGTAEVAQRLGRTRGITGLHLRNVHYQQDGLLGEEGESAEHRPLGVAPDGLMDGPFGLEGRAAAAEEFEFALIGLAFGRGLENLLFEPLDPPQGDIEVRQGKLAEENVAVAAQRRGPKDAARARSRRRGGQE